jgi:23S rRNA (uracil1939-C5)-methyltransferase
MNSFSVGEIHPLNLTGLAVGGEAVGRIDNMAVFVPFGTPGDEIEVRLSDLKKNFARGEIERISRSSVHRTKPPCPIFYRCGGCQLQQMTYGAQLLYKGKMLEEILQHLGNLKDVRIESIVEAPNPFNYRNKMQVVAAAKPFLHSEKISPYFGLYAKQTHQVIRMDECIIQHSLANQALKIVKDAVTKLQWEIYNEHTNRGLLRYVVTRISYTYDQMMLILVTTTDKVPGIQEFVQIVTRKIPQLRGIVVNVNDKKTNVALGNTNRVVWGEDHLIEEIDGIKYVISPNSFFQVNPLQTRQMFKIIENHLEPLERDIILDLYCGVGAISLWLAGKVQKVIGIEEVPQAKKDAIESAKINKIKNFEFHVGRVEKILPDLYNRGCPIDKLVLDPPRKGCDESTLELISKMRIKRVVYISCNPSTLARDLSYLKDQGYKIDTITPIDMFPQTYHIECIAKLTHQPTTFLRNVLRRVPSSKLSNPFATNILENEESQAASGDVQPVNSGMKKTALKDRMGITSEKMKRRNFYSKYKADSTNKLSFKTRILDDAPTQKSKKTEEKSLPKTKEQEKTSVTKTRKNKPEVNKNKVKAKKKPRKKK